MTRTRNEVTAIVDNDMSAVVELVSYLHAETTGENFAVNLSAVVELEKYLLACNDPDFVRSLCAGLFLHDGKIDFLKSGDAADVANPLLLARRRGNVPLNAGASEEPTLLLQARSESSVLLFFHRREPAAVSL